MVSQNRNGFFQEKAGGRTERSVVAHFEFLMVSSLVDDVIPSTSSGQALSGAVLQAERRIPATTLCATGDPSARW